MTKFVDAKTASRILELSRQWVTHLVRDGKLSGQKLGSGWIITKSSVEKYQTRKAKKSTTK